MRRAGILLHISSLPSPGFIGDLGSEAYEFVDFLRETKQSIWNILPVHPTLTELGNSPYNTTSLFAGNILFISIDTLIKEGYLERKKYRKIYFSEKVDYRKAYAFKEKHLREAFKNFRDSKDRDFYNFCEENCFWLESYALFEVMRKKYGLPWNKWKNIDVEEEEIEYIKFTQYIFFKQWFNLKNYANSKGILIFGDMPIYPSYSSADVWSNPGIFKLNKNMKPKYVAGVPPDYFSSKGQLWGNPVYDWGELKNQNFDWWVKRIGHALKLYDMVRIDHFRGLIAYWEVPYGSATAREGKWVKVPYRDFFNALFKYTDRCRIVAEDLGYIDSEVREVRSKYNLRGMKVLQFAFDEDNSEYMPHNWERDTVAYTGTHDNPTLREWLENLTEKQRNRLLRYIGYAQGTDIIDTLIRLTYMSVADTVIIPMQDILRLGEEARMNKPGRKKGNWRWRLKKDVLLSAVDYLKELSETYARY